MTPNLPLRVLAKAIFVSLRGTCRGQALALLVLLISSSSAWAQLTGTKTIPGSYASLAQAIVDLNAQGVGAGGVTFNIAAGYTETFTSPTAGRITLNSTTPASGPTFQTSGTNPIVFQKAGSGANPLITGGVGTSTADAIISVVGTDNVTFTNIDVADNSANTTATTQMEYGYALFRASATDGSQYVSITGATITLNKTNSATVAVRSLSADATGTALAATSAAGANSFTKLNGITAANAFIGLYVSGTSATYPDASDEVGTTTGNTMTGIGGSNANSVYGIRVEYVSNVKVENNMVSIPSGNTTTTIYGISLGVSAATAIVGTVLLNNNTVSLTSATSATVIGINQAGSSAVTSTTITNNKVQNSVLSGAGSNTVTYILDASAATGLTSTITSNAITGNSATTTGIVSGIYRSGATGTANINTNTVGTAASGNTVAAAGGTFYAIRATTGTITLNGNSIVNNTFTASGSAAAIVYGYYNFGSPTSETLTNNTITGLVINGTGTYTTHTLGGIYTNTVSSAVKSISGNVIGGLAIGTSGGAASGTVIGISQLLGTTVTISQNRIYGLTAYGAAGLVNGLLLSSGTTINASNNLLGLLTAPGATSTTAIAGIQVSGGTTANLYYNTIYLNASGGGTTFGTSGIYLASTTPTADLRNNIVVNSSTPGSSGGLTVALRRVATGVAGYNSTSNNNLYYAGAPAANRLLYSDGTNSYQTLANLQGGTGISPREAASKTEDVPFANTTDGTLGTTYLHINPSTPTQAESGGAPIGSYTIDYDGDTRSATTPDIGADEGTFTPNDIVPPAITYTALANTASTANRTLAATITDASGLAIGTGAPLIYYRLGTSGAYYSAVATSVAGSTYTFTIDYATIGGTPAGGSVIQYYVAAQDASANNNVATSPAGGTGSNPPGSTTPAGPNSYTIIGPLPTAVSVGTGQAYTSLTNTGGLFDAINLGALSGNTVVTITSDLTNETGAVALNSLANGSTSYTLTIQSDGTLRTISGSYATNSTASLNGLLRLNGANNVTISGGSGTSNLATASRSLRFRNTGTAPVFLLLNGASTNLITNTIIEGGVTTGTITLDGTTAINGNTIAYNDIRDRSDITTTSSTIPTNAIYATGTVSGMTVKGNAIRNFTGAGVFANTTAGDGWVVGGSTTTDGNLIYQEASRSSTLYGVELLAGSSHTIRYNSVYQTSGTLSGTLFGIYLTGGGTSHVVSNNTIGGAAPDGSGTLTTTGTFFGIRLPSVGTAAATAALVQGNTIKNITSTATGTSYGINVASTAGAAIIGGNTAALGNTLNNLNTAYDFYGIAVPAASGLLTVRYNTVSVVRYSGSVTQPLLLGIYCNSSAPTSILSNNTVSDMMRTGSGSQGTAVAIDAAGTSAFTIDANVINSFGTATLVGSNHTVYGIEAEATGACFITNNLVSGIISGSPGSGSSIASTTVGIELEGGSATATGNTISDISNTSTSGAGTGSYAQVIGLDVGTTGAATVLRNRIYNVRTATAAATSGYVYDGAQGIELYGTPSSVLLANNQISLSTGTSTGIVAGILDASTGTANTLSFNSVYVAGSSTGGSYGYRRTSTATTTLRNNIFYNEHTGSGSNYAIATPTPGWSGSTTNPSINASDYNLLFAPDAAKVGLFGSTSYTFAGWKTATSGDASSLSELNTVVPSASLFTNTATGDLSLNASNSAAWYANGTGTQVATLSTDYTGAARSTTVAAGAPDIGSVEFTPTATPPALSVSAAPSLGGTQAFSLGGRPLASLAWGSGGTVPTSVMARYYSGSNPPAPFLANAKYANVYLTFTNNNADGSGFTYTPTFNYDPALLGTIASEANQRVAQRGADNNGYDVYATTVNTTARILTGPQYFNRLSLFAISDATNPLPVTLTRFEAVRQGQDAALSWRTASEVNNAGFEVQVSIDGQSFRKLSFVASTSTASNTAHTYAFLDQEASKAGRRYYRLRQLDLDGSEHFSPVRTVEFEILAVELSAAPNPFQQSLTLRLSLPTTSPATLSLTDALGRVVRTQALGQLAAGTSQPTLDGLSNLPTGMYVLRLSLAGSTHTLKVVRE